MKREDAAKYYWKLANTAKSLQDEPYDPETERDISRTYGRMLQLKEKYRLDDDILNKYKSKEK